MKSTHDLSGLMKFLKQESWADRLDSVIAEHMGPALEEFGIDYKELDDLIGAQWAMTLWGCAFEALLTHSFEPDDTNIVEVYLKRRGWKEKAPNKAYMKALRHSVMSLYEVSNVVPGQSMLARDMVREAEPILVIERSATRSLTQWDRIGARIVTVNGRNILAGGLLIFSHEAAESVLDGIAATLAESGPEAFDSIDSDLLLVDLAPLFTNAWLFDTLGKVLRQPQRVLHNSDGDEVIFHTVRWAVTKSVMQAQVVERLNGIPALRRAHGKSWNWLDISSDSNPTKSNDENGLLWNTFMEDGTRVLATVEVKGRFVTLSVSSEPRAARGKAILGEVLGDLVGPPLTEITTLDQACAADIVDDDPALDIPQEQLEKISHDMFERHYRGTLEVPVGMLDGITPRAAAATVAGQRKLAAWLKYLENGTAKNKQAGHPMASYDFGWMWRELGIEHLRR